MKRVPGQNLKILIKLFGPGPGSFGLLITGTAATFTEGDIITIMISLMIIAN